MSGFGWVTLATNDTYSLGALVLAHSLRRVGTIHQLIVMVTPGVTQSMREKLRSVFDLIVEVNILDSKDERNLLLLQRPELGITFTKMHCWRLTQYLKCVFLDADTLVLQNCDELFDRDEFSAAPDVGWPDCFNSGVFVYRPSEETFNSLLAFALERGSFDGGDQGLLNLYFSDWAHQDINKHLPFIYNMCSTACYSYLPAFKQFGENVKIVHFIGNSKPWLQYFNSETLQVSSSPNFEHLQQVFELWWNLFCTHVHSNLQPTMGGLAGAFAQITLRQPRTADQDALEDHLRRQGWEAGRIDYLGQDSFENVWKKICETMASAPKKEPSPPKPAPVESPTAGAESVTSPAETATSPTPAAEPAVVSTPALTTESTPLSTPVELEPLTASAPEPATPPTPAVEPAAVSDPAPPSTPAAESAALTQPVPIAELVTTPTPAVEPAPISAPTAEPTTVATPPAERAVVAAPIPIAEPATPPTPAAPVAEPAAAESAAVAAPIPAAPVAEPAGISASVSPSTDESTIVSTSAAESAAVAAPIPVAEPATPPTPVAEPAAAESAAVAAPIPVAEPATPPTPIASAPAPAAEPTIASTPDTEPPITPLSATESAAAPISAVSASPAESPTTPPSATEAAVASAPPPGAEQIATPISKQPPTPAAEPSAPTVVPTSAPVSKPTPATASATVTTSKPADVQTSSTPVPPPRKSGKNGAGTKKTSKKK